MAKLITETETFHDSHTITVPEGTDSVVNAAEVVEAFVQKLANRTWFLKLNKLQKNLFNVLEGAGGFEFPMGEAAWRLLFRLTVGPGEYLNLVNIYSGWSESPDAASQFAIVYNAEFDGTDWVQLRSDRKSWAFMMGHNASAAPFVFASKAAGSSPWASSAWTIDVSMGGSNLNLVANGEFSYLPARRKTSIMHGVGVLGGHHTGTGAMNTDGSYAWFDIQLPPNMTNTAGVIEVVHYQSTAAPSTFALVERTVNYTTPAAATQTDLVTASGPGSSGHKKSTLSLASITFNPDKEYRLVWRPGVAGDTMEGWRIKDWDDSGPINFLG